MVEITVKVEGATVFIWADGQAPVVVDKDDNLNPAWVRAHLRAAAEYLSAHMARPVTLVLRGDGAGHIMAERRTGPEGGPLQGAGPA